jgi:hypothetical protein
MKDYEKIKLEEKVYLFLSENPTDKEIVDRIKGFAKIHTVWQAYVETVKALGTMWKCFGINSYSISNLDYALVHIQLFKKLLPGERRIIVSKMEELMKERLFLRSDEVLQLYKELT